MVSDRADGLSRRVFCAELSLTSRSVLLLTLSGPGWSTVLRCARVTYRNLVVTFTSSVLMLYGSHVHTVRHAYPMGQIYTRLRIVGGRLESAFCIGHIVLHERVSCKIRGAAITTSFFSDHRQVDVFLMGKTPRVQKRAIGNRQVWQMNLGLLDDGSFLPLLQQDFISSTAQRHRFSHLADWWDGVKLHVHNVGQDVFRRRGGKRAGKARTLLAINTCRAGNSSAEGRR